MPAICHIWVRSRDQARQACYIRDSLYFRPTGVKTWLSTETVNLCLSDETLKAVGPFYLVTVSGESLYPTLSVHAESVCLTVTVCLSL